jgi:hypothetical protein
MDIQLTHDDFMALVHRRRLEIRTYLEWALANERRAVKSNGSGSWRMDARPDIRDAAEAAESFSEAWWGIVVFSCFGSKLGAKEVAPRFRHPLAPSEVDDALGQIEFRRGSVGHHRIQPGHAGAKRALRSACERSDLFQSVLHDNRSFDARYWDLRSAHLAQWGRTTCLDLLLRAGALGIGGRNCLPEFAYLDGSTGPSKGFDAVFGVQITHDNAPWAETVLQAWADNWDEVAGRVGVGWEGAPLLPRDQENFLCIYQEELGRAPRSRDTRRARGSCQ